MSESASPLQPDFTVEPTTPAPEGTPPVAEMVVSTSTSEQSGTKVKRVGLLYLISFALASTVGGLSAVCIKQLLLPLQVAVLDPLTTTLSFTLIASTGAFAGLVAAPLTGALSDRTTARWGRRRTWIVGGITCATGGLFIMASAPSIAVLLLGQVIAQIGVDSLLSVISALIPDQISQRQRSMAAAVNGMAPILGGIAGLVLVTRLTDTTMVMQGYTLLAGLSVFCIALFLLVLREKPILQPALPTFSLRAFLASFLRPLRSRDFVYTLLSRICAFLSYTLLGSYLLFSLRARLDFSAGAAAQGTATFQLVSTGVLVCAAIAAGVLSRRLQMLKPFVTGGALVMTLGLVILVGAPTWGWMLVAAGCFGCGFGFYVSVDMALAIQVLPNIQDAGKDLGLMHMAIFLALILSPIIGTGVLFLFQENFAILFGVAAGASLLAALLIQPIRGVR